MESGASQQPPTIKVLDEVGPSAPPVPLLVTEIKKLSRIVNRIMPLPSEKSGNLGISRIACEYGFCVGPKRATKHQTRRREAFGSRQTLPLIVRICEMISHNSDYLHGFANSMHYFASISTSVTSDYADDQPMAMP